MAPKIDENIIAMEFESQAIAHCNSVLEITLPHCSFDDLQNRKFYDYGDGKEMDGFGYILNDSGNAGVESKEHGVVPLTWEGSTDGRIPTTPQNKTPKKKKRNKNKPTTNAKTLQTSPEANLRRVEKKATKYIVAEAFMGVSNYSQEMTQADHEKEAKKATQKLIQLGNSLDYLKKRYSDQKVLSGNKDSPNENFVNGAAYLATYCYSDDDETSGDKTDRSKKLERLKEALEEQLKKIWKEKEDTRLDELFRLASQNRLFLAVLSNREAYRTSTAINMAKKMDKGFDRLDKKIDRLTGLLDKKIDRLTGLLDKKIDRLTCLLICLFIWLTGLLICLFIWLLSQTHLNTSS